MIIGLTGGIGSGKSLVSEILKNEYGFEVIQTDKLASVLMNNSRPLKEELKNAFGDEIYLEDETLDKKKYTELIYSDAEKQKISDDIVHPAVWKETRSLILACRLKYLNAAVETALPGETLAELCDTVWYVHTDDAIRVQRLAATRGYSEEFAEMVMKKQPDESQYARIAEYVICNNGTVDDLREEIRELL